MLPDNFLSIRAGSQRNTKKMMSDDTFCKFTNLWIYAVDPPNVRGALYRTAGRRRTLNRFLFSRIRKGASPDDTLLLPASTGRCRPPLDYQEWRRLRHGFSPVRVGHGGNRNRNLARPTAVGACSYDDGGGSSGHSHLDAGEWNYRRERRADAALGAEHGGSERGDDGEGG